MFFLIKFYFSRQNRSLLYASHDLRTLLILSLATGLFFAHNYIIRMHLNSENRNSSSPWIVWHIYSIILYSQIFNSLNTRLFGLPNILILSIGVFCWPNIYGLPIIIIWSTIRFQPWYTLPNQKYSYHTKYTCTDCAIYRLNIQVRS